jgi:acyl carrier protein
MKREIEAYVRMRIGFLTGNDPQSIGNDDGLEQFGLDSLDLAELAVDVEDKFDANFTDRPAMHTIDEFVTAVLETMPKAAA